MKLRIDNNKESSIPSSLAGLWIILSLLFVKTFLLFWNNFLIFYDLLYAFCKLMEK